MNNNNLQQAIVFIESNTSGTGAIFLSNAYKMGYQVIFMTSDITRYNFSFEKIHVCVTDTKNPDTIIKALKKYSENLEIKGILSSSDRYVDVATVCAKLLKLPSSDPFTIKRCQDKLKQYQVIKKIGLSIPHFMPIKTLDDIKNSSDLLPFVIKPRVGTGSTDVIIFKNFNDINNYCLSKKNNLQDTADLLLCSYCIGSEHSVEIFDGHAIALIDKHLSPEPWCIEIGHNYPSSLDYKTIKRAYKFAEDIVKALGLVWGPIHVEIRIDKTGKLFLIEVNPRLAGGFIPELIRLCSGINLIEMTIQKSIGITNSIPYPTNIKFGAIKFLYVQKKTTLTKSNYVSKILNVEINIKFYGFFPREIEPHHDFRDRYGHVLVISNNVGVNMLEVNKIANDIISDLKANTNE